MHGHRAANTLDDAEFSRNAVLWGAYVGEVLRRELDGAAHWQRDSALGPETFPVVHDAGDESSPGESFPCGWCVRRIQNGPEDAPWDGEDFVLTHYCATGNQPKMRLDREHSTAKKYIFEFAGGTNLDPAVDEHIHSAEIEWLEGGELKSVWTEYNGGEQAGVMTFKLTRSE